MNDDKTGDDSRHAIDDSDDLKKDIWQKRVRRAGLTQAELARLAGVREIAVSQGLRGKGRAGSVPIYLRTIIRLWEIADKDQRERIISDPDSN